MVMVLRHKELQKASMITFSKDYFLKHYGEQGRKNPLSKLESYWQELSQLVAQGSSKISVLDIGCGYGAFLTLLESKSKFETYGTDTSSFAISEAKKRTKKTKYWTASLERFDPRRNFQVITAFDILEHIPDLESSLDKIYNLLEKDGKFLCVVPVYDGPVGRLGGFLDDDITHIHRKSRHFWIKTLGSKFTILKVKGILRYEFPLVGYLHLKSTLLANWGQAILISMEKPK